MKISWKMVTLFWAVFFLVFFSTLVACAQPVPTTAQQAAKDDADSNHQIVATYHANYLTDDAALDALMPELSNHSNCTECEDEEADFMLGDSSYGIVADRLEYTNAFNELMEDEGPNYGIVWSYFDRYDAGLVLWNSAVYQYHYEMAIAIWEDGGPLDEDDHLDAEVAMDETHAIVEEALADGIVLGEYLVDCAESSECLECGEEECE
jgi:hypothetical protein